MPVGARSRLLVYLCGVALLAMLADATFALGAPWPVRCDQRFLPSDCAIETVDVLPRVPKARPAFARAVLPSRANVDGWVNPEGQPSTVYRYRIEVSNQAGTRTGSYATFITGSYDDLVLTDHPVAYWAMTGSTVEPDLTGAGHTGTYMGGPRPKATLPDGELANDFNDSGSQLGQYLRVPTSPVFSIATAHALTFEAWIRPDVLQFAHPASGDGYIDWMGKCQEYSPSCEWEARMYSARTSQGRADRLSAYVFNPSAGLGSAADWQPAGRALSPGRWLYVVGEYQTRSTPRQCNRAYPGTINIWVDGVQQDFAIHQPTGCMSQHDIHPTAGSSPLDIGTMALDSWFQGAVGKLAIYDTLLSQAQISAHYAAMTGLAPNGSCREVCRLLHPAPPTYAAHVRRD